MKSKKYITLACLGLVLLLLIALQRCCALFFGYHEEETYTSPAGTNTIVVKYDMLCRPDVFQKGLLWDKKIWSYPGSGFMETVHFGVEWLSETEILLTYEDIRHDEFNEAYRITLPAS